jgi:hypothetical protein
MSSLLLIGLGLVVLALVVGGVAGALVGWLTKRCPAAEELARVTASVVPEESATIPPRVRRVLLAAAQERQELLARAEARELLQMAAVKAEDPPAPAPSPTPPA